MEKKRIEYLKSMFGTVKYIEGPLDGFPDSWTDWFLLEISPLPSTNELEVVAADIDKNRYIAVGERGRLSHSKNCTADNHSLSELVKNTLYNIPDTTFKVAVFKGKHGELSGQPIAIPLEPTINYAKYPDHPHLNVGYPIDNKFYLPDSLCYNVSPNTLGSSGDDPLLEAFDQISEWLFRHQIWIATRRQETTGKWIGHGVNMLKSYEYVFFINPYGKCRCGKEKQYRNCCLLVDYVEAERTLKDSPRLQHFYREMRMPWQQRIGQPQEKALQFLKSQLL